MSDGDFQMLGDPVQIVVVEKENRNYAKSIEDPVEVGKSMLKAYIQGLANSLPNDSDLGKVVRAWSTTDSTQITNDNTTN